MPDATAVKLRKRRERKRYAVVEKKMIFELDNKFRIQFPVENQEVYAPELLSIAGANFEGKIPFNPTGTIPEDQVTFCAVYTVPKSDENLQTIAKFGKAHRFNFESDIAVRAFSATAEGKLLEKMSYAQSLSSNSTLKFPKFGNDPKTKKPLKLLPFQPAGVEYLLRAKRTFLADEMGLGKTVQAIAGMAVIKKWPWLVVVPANLKYNWLKELKKWMKPLRYQGKALQISLLTNSVLQKTPKGKWSKQTKQFFAETQIVVVNYDRLHKYQEYLKEVAWTGVVFDESHYLKGMNALRSKVSRDMIDTINPEYLWMLSGTPLMNKPLDIAAQLRTMGRLNDFGGFNHFAVRYCTVTSPDPTHMERIAAQAKAAIEADAKGEEVVPFDQNDDPLSAQALKDALIRKLYENMTALNKQLRAQCYIRREKSEVLKFLPAKTRQTLFFDITNRKTYQKIEEDVSNYLADLAIKEEKFLDSLKGMTPQQVTDAIKERRASKYYKSARAEAIVRLNTLKFTAAVGKLQAAKQWIEDYLESGKKLVIFAHHRKMIDELIDAFPTAAHTKGSMKERDAQIERFQTDPKCNLFIGSLKRDGVGLTLTAAQDTAFLELGWTPALHDQAEDRTHRIGQNEAVVAHYLLAKDTVEESIARLIEKKRKVVGAVADGDPLHNAQQGSILGDLIEDLTGKRTVMSKKTRSKVVQSTEEAAA